MPKYWSYAPLGVTGGRVRKTRVYSLEFCADTEFEEPQDLVQSWIVTPIFYNCASTCCSRAVPRIEAGSLRVAECASNMAEIDSHLPQEHMLGAAAHLICERQAATAERHLTTRFW